MFNDKSPLLLNMVLVIVIALAIYLGLMYMENQKAVQAELKGVSSLPKGSQEVKAEPGSSLPEVPSATKPKDQPLPQAPLYIKDDLKKLIDDSASMKTVFKGYGSFGLVVGDVSFTVILNDDGSLNDVTKGLGAGISFTIRSDESTFRKLLILVQRENVLGITARLNDMKFDPESKRKEIIDRINSAQGFTSNVYSG